jgi:glyoxylase-like metal-dependent hydrolase (beta-lactamase superfamily II)
MAKWKVSAGIEIREIVDGLHVISNPSAGRKTRHSYLLVRESGNLLFHGPDQASFYKQYGDFFDEQGGIGLQVLTHAPEASPACAAVLSRWKADLYLHEWDLPEMVRKSGLSTEKIFSGRHMLPGGDVEAIPLPGHTLGFTGYRFEIDGGRFLVSGDMIVENIKGWRAKVPKVLAELGAKSLETLRGIEVDFLIPNQSSDQGPPIPFGHDERERIVDEAADALARKAK